jgi:hypothetical protein
MAETYIPIVFGAIVGGLVSFVFILRTNALSDDPGRTSTSTVTRQQVLRVALMTYIVIAWVSLIVALALNDTGFIVTTAIITLVTMVVSAVQWSRES